MKRFKRTLYAFLKNDGLLFLFSFVMVAALYCYFRSLSNIIDYPVFSSVVITIVFNRLIEFLKKPIMNKLEDRFKLTTDYDALTDTYKDTENLVTYDNSNTDDVNKVLKLFGKVEFTFPVCCDFKSDDLKIEIIDSPNIMYESPQFVEKHFDELIEAHKTSSLENNLNIRVDDWFLKNGKLFIITSRTTYLDSMSTNRVMDYSLPCGVCVRELYEFGPIINPLNKSKLSNHLGFNAFVETSDGQIVFVKRSKDVSIGKETYGNSIGASIKVKYALNKNHEFDSVHLDKSILCEINDELSIESKYIECFYKIATYRDLLEGGKPQILVYAKSSLTKDEVITKFNFNKFENAKKMRADGTKLLWIPKDDLKHISIVPRGVFYKHKFYPMLPSASASLVIFIKYLEKSTDQIKQISMV